jgi:transposase-like protein
MPFEQKYTDETREKSLARVLERREAEPGNRAIIRETAEEFEVGEQSLRGWIRAHEKANAPAPVEPEVAAEAAEADESLEEAAAAVAAPRRGRPPGSGSAATSDRISELEAEVAQLRADREALKRAIAVIVAD